MVPENILLNILLDYAGDLRSWLSARCLNHHFLSEVRIETKKVLATSHGSYGIINYSRCGSCNETHDDLSVLNYHTNMCGHKSCIAYYCSKWRCKVDSLKCMLEHAEDTNKVILMERWSKENIFQIPRSAKRDINGVLISPLFTEGTVETRWVHKLDNRLCAYCEWMSGSESFYKCVDIKDLGFAGAVKTVTIFK